MKMFSRLIALLLWLVGGLAFGQSINGVSPTSAGLDPSNSTGDKVLTLPQVQTTPGGTPTPQTSNWYQLNGNAAVMVEFQSNTFAGSYAVDVSNLPTPVSTPGVGYYTAVQDDATYTSGGQGTQTKNWAYILSDGWKWFRFRTTPETGNAGTLNLQARVFGSGPQGTTGAIGASANRTFGKGVPWKSADILNNAAVLAAGTFYSDYKMPMDAQGFIVYNNIGVSGTVTLVSTVCYKDPTTGQLLAQVLGPATGAGSNSAGELAIRMKSSFAYAIPAATPSVSTTYGGLDGVQDIVIKNVVTGTGAVTLTQSAVPSR